MVLDVLAGTILLAIGILVVYYNSDSDLNDSHFLVYLLAGIAAIIAGGWIIITRIPLATLLMKVAGLVLVLVGFFLVRNFPDSTDYSQDAMARTGVLIGLIMLILGLYLLFFA